MEQEKRPIVEGDKRPIVEQEKRPIVEQEKRPIVEQEKRPIVEQEKRPIVERDKGPIVERDKRPIVERDKRPRKEVPSSATHRERGTMMRTVVWKVVPLPHSREISRGELFQPPLLRVELCRHLHIALRSDGRPSNACVVNDALLNKVDRMSVFTRLSRAPRKRVARSAL